MRKHYLIFIHGIGEREPDDATRYAINRGYVQLWQAINQRYERRYQKKLNHRVVPLYVNWHTQVLNQAECTLYNTAFQPPHPSLSLSSFLRNFTTFYLGDIIAYLSEDVNLIRQTIWWKIWSELEHPLKKEQASYSIVAHSLGSVIAFDYLYSLFYKCEIFLPNSTPASVGIGRSKLSPWLKPSEIDLLQTRFCHFFTLGSPIGLFMLRKGQLWTRSHPFYSILNPVLGMRRTWLNFYDRRDVVAYPLANLFKLNPENLTLNLPHDIPVRNGFTHIAAHGHYWRNRQVADRIAQTLGQRNFL